MSTAISGCILAHTDIQDCPRRLNQRILILTFPLDVLHDPSISNTIDGISVLHGVVIVQQIGCQIIGMVYHENDIANPLYTKDSNQACPLRSLQYRKH